MIAGGYRLSEAARSDVSEILHDTVQRFGVRQRRTYQGLMEQAAGMVAEAPDRGGSRQRSDLGSGIRSFHIELAAARRGAAAHVLYYRINESDPALPRVLILRVLHQAMEPGRHLTGDFP